MPRKSRTTKTVKKTKKYRKRAVGIPNNYLSKLMPPHKIVDLEIFNTFVLPVASAQSGTYYINLSSLQTPLNPGAPFASPLPGPLTPVASCSYTGFQNFIYNSTTGTGLYRSYRPLSSSVTFTASPQAYGDSSIITLSTCQDGTFGSVTTSGSAPSSIYKVVYCGNDAKANTLNFKCQHHVALGITKTQYDDYTYTSQFGSVTASPVVLQIRYQTLDQAATSTPMSFAVRIKTRVMFTQFTSAVLLDA